jgi:predicted HicB family RNase H-like nuclease
MSDRFIGFRTSKELKDKAKAAAKKKGVSLSCLLRQVIRHKLFWILIKKDL